MSSWDTVRVVAAREFRERARSRAFIWATAVFLLLSLGVVVGSLIVGVVVGRSARQPTVVGVVGGDRGLREALEALRTEEVAGSRLPDAAPGVELRSLPDLGAAREALRAGDVELVVVGYRQILVEDPIRTDEELIDAVSLVVRFQAAARGTEAPADVVVSALRAERPEVRSLEEPSPERAGRLLLTGGATILLFFVLITGSGLIMTGVVEEKASRVVELLVSAVRPRLFLAGKILGLGALAVVQLLIVASPLLLPALLATGLILPSGWPWMVPVTVLWTLLGFAFYAYAFAAMASLVSRMEDLQTAILPIWLPLFVNFYAAIPATTFADATWVRVLSFLPPTAPGTMLARISAGTVAPWEVVVSVLVMAGATWVLAVVAARIYSAGVLRFGQRISLREAWRTAEG